MIFPELVSKFRLCALTAFLFTAAGAMANTVAITEFLNDSHSPETGGEWVELYNYGNSPVNISNWKLKDDDSDLITLPAYTIQPKDFVILARTKTDFELRWFKGVANARVIQQPAGFAMSDPGPDELVLNDASNVLVWRLAYGTVTTDGSTFFADNDFTVNNHGTKTTVIDRNGNDAQPVALGYQGQEFTRDPWSISGVGISGSPDIGSPLRGNYTGAINPVQPTSFVVNLATPGTYLNPGVRGLAIADQALSRGDNSDQVAVIPCVQTAVGSSIRGISGGLNADIYDWKTRNAQPRPTTLHFMRYARDYDEELYITANIRGLTVPDATSPTTHRMYYTSDTATLASLAGDWVRYTNRIAQYYRQGDTITDSRDAAIVNALTWNSAYVNTFGTADNFTTLLAPGEERVKPIKYWEIGNEPLVSLANAYSVTNAFTFTGSAGHSTHADWVNRYIALTTAMVAEDPSIKVGPCIVNARPGNNAAILSLLLQSSARVDFIAYHPYGSMGDQPFSPHWQEGYLTGVHNEQANFLQEIKDLVTQYRPGQVSTMEYAATETNVSNWPSNNQFQEGTMAHALGSVESVFSWGRMGLSAAHYWVWITGGGTTISDNNRFVVTMAFEKLRDKLGSELLGVFDAHDKVRVYVVKNPLTREITVWAMNFANAGDVNFQLSLTNGPGAAFSRVKKQVLQNISGPTTLFSANIAPEQNFGVPRRDVDWTAPVELSGADPANLSITLPASTLTLLTVENLTATAAEDWSLYQ